MEKIDFRRALRELYAPSSDDEAPTLSRLHHDYMPTHGFDFNGKHHEIYLGDPRKAQPAKLRTIVQQPVKPRQVVRS